MAVYEVNVATITTHKIVCNKESEAHEMACKQAEAGIFDSVKDIRSLIAFEQREVKNVD